MVLYEFLAVFVCVRPVFEKAIIPSWLSLRACAAPVWYTREVKGRCKAKKSAYDLSPSGFNGFILGLVGSYLTSDTGSWGEDHKEDICNVPIKRELRAQAIDVLPSGTWWCEQARYGLGLCHEVTEGDLRWLPRCDWLWLHESSQSSMPAEQGRM